MPTTTGMKGDGFYNAHSAPQRVALESALTKLEAAITELPNAWLDEPYFGILDIGSSEGANAIYAMNQLIQVLRRRLKTPIWAWFNDLPTNDFNQLFKNLFPTEGQALLGADVFPGVIGGSGFGRLVPPQTIHMATTFNAIAFLEQKPDAPLPNYVLPMGPGSAAPRSGVAVTNEEREPFRKQAQKDLYQFYAARAEEVVSGGQLLVQVFGRNKQYSTSFGIYDVLNDAVLDFVEDGQLPRQVFENLIFPIYFRTIEELVAPIENESQLGQVFRIEQTISEEIPVPFNQALEENGDVASWSKSYTGFLRAFTEAILDSALPENLDKPVMLNHIYERIEQRLTINPERYEFHYISIGALLTRL